ncbi:SDR family oxidoreductase [Sphingobacterium alkalisoli]|uniref:SDR family oxidoreductase n=1 Tax=Sphingobacterium alkalisoli TaxID=1874115 RepID=A0A4U0GU67_9SPHI|nr:SDR family oxidoreductase [Sphingobacterium alkalisoli]TJY62507.1 SDR family oxidoreductase [Sphingobacterium alkalisoli]GGH29043.1 3-beta hydroxysteroid dehydrogenase [Sphingobacterium alkalisoli]
MSTKKVLVAGATGYLGQFLVRELKSRGFWVRVLIRKEAQKDKFKNVDDFFIGQITEPNTIKGITNNIDWIFSSIGITRQKDGMTYMDVDYQGNSNLLKEALKDKVEAFEYISAINGDKLKQLKIFEAKEKFVDELKSSRINYCVLRPNGFFSDMKDFLNMAKAGRVYLFGDGKFKLNPIHGEDLAKVCVDKMIAGAKEETVGGADILTQNELAELALNAWHKPIKISHLPDWTRRFTIWFMRTFTSSKTYGPIEFFLTAMAFDNIANQYGTNRLKDFFKFEVKRMKE